MMPNETPVSDKIQIPFFLIPLLILLIEVVVNYYQGKNRQIANLLNYSGKSKKVDLEQVDTYGHTPLTNALFFYGKHADVKSLLEQGANPNKKDRNGDTPLHLAAGRNSVEAARHLLAQKGILCDQINQCGETPLHIAIGHDNSLEMVALLLEAGADPNKRSIYGWSLLHRLAFRHPKRQPQAPQLIDLLVAYGAKIDARDCLGLIPFQDAVYFDRLEMLQKFIGYRAHLTLEGQRTLKYHKFPVNREKQIREALQSSYDTSDALYYGLGNGIFSTLITFGFKQAQEARQEAKKAELQIVPFKERQLRL